MRVFHCDTMVMQTVHRKSLDKPFGVCARQVVSVRCYSWLQVPLQSDYLKCIASLIAISPDLWLQQSRIHRLEKASSYWEYIQTTSEGILVIYENLVNEDPANQDVITKSKKFTRSTQYGRRYTRLFFCRHNSSSGMKYPLANELISLYEICENGAFLR